MPVESRESGGGESRRRECPKQKKSVGDIPKCSGQFIYRIFQSPENQRYIKLLQFSDCAVKSHRSSSSVGSIMTEPPVQKRKRTERPTATLCPWNSLKAIASTLKTASEPSTVVRNYPTPARGRGPWLSRVPRVAPWDRGPIAGSTTERRTWPTWRFRTRQLPAMAQRAGQRSATANRCGDLANGVDEPVTRRVPFSTWKKTRFLPKREDANLQIGDKSPVE